MFRALGIGFAASTSIGLGVALAESAAADPPRESPLRQNDGLGPITIGVPADAPMTHTPVMRHGHLSDLRRSPRLVEAGHGR